MRRYFYYANGGSGNHGCEAIIRSLESILTPDSRSISLAVSPVQDSKYGIDKLVDITDIQSAKHNNLTFAKAYFDLKIRKQKFALDIFPYQYFFKHLKKNRNLHIALSVGGDNYCYGGSDFYYCLDRTIHDHGIKTALVGCSIEPEIVSDEKVKRDLQSHSVIIARESLTYEAMLDNGLRNVFLIPDPAFLLKVQTSDLQIAESEKDYIGINLSPLVNQCSQDGNLIMRNAETLINHIIESSDMNIVLIPHVVWPQSNDLETLLPLYEKFKNTGRVQLVKDGTAEELKGYISRCRFFIAARTHASIAAYSTCVPTLVIGYSVKSKGIAKDIFGTSDKYVISAQSFKKETELVEGFEWLKENERSIKVHLQTFMPEYCKRAYQIKEVLENIN